MYTPSFAAALLAASALALASNSVHASASANTHLRIHESNQKSAPAVLEQCLWADHSVSCQQGQECIEETKGFGRCFKSSPQEGDNCGGMSVNGEWSRPCASGTYCHRYDGEYSQCQANNNGGGNVAVWGQCGGKEYYGSTTCTEGSHCVYSNDWYSQCLPN